MTRWPWLGRVAWVVAWPVNYLAIRFSRRTRVLIICNDEVLMVKSWLGSGKWGLPGGGLHQGEDPVQGALREIKEETSINASPEQLVAVGDYAYRFRGFHYDCIFFKLEFAAKPEIAKQAGEIVEIGWFPRAAIAGMDCEPDVRYALNL